MERHCDAAYARTVELKTNQTEVGFPCERIQLGASGYESFKQKRIDGIIEH